MALVNGNVITVDPEFRIAEAVAVKGGRVAAVGSNSAIKEMISQFTEVIDLDGETVLPGLIDAHLHVLMTGLGMLMVNCRTPPVKTIEDLKSAVRDRAGRDGPGVWIEGRGWDQAKLAEHRAPTRWELDEAAPDNPVFLIRTCEHIVAVNSKALDMAGVDKDTPQPVGGEIVRDELGEPTGILREMPAFQLVRRHIPLPDFKRKVEAIRLATAAFSRAGLTSVVDAGLTEEEMRAHQIALREGGLAVRVSMMLWGVDGDESLESSLRRIGLFPMATGFGNEMLQFLGLKLVVDGSLGGRSALMREPYENDTSSGLLIVPEDKLRRLVDAGNMHGMNIGIHCCGGRAMDVALKAYEETDKKKPIRGRRFSLIHAYQPSEENFEQCKRLGVVVASQPGFLFYLGDSFNENIGSERAVRLKPHRAWLDNGAVVASSTDSPVTPYLPFTTLWASIARRTEVRGTQMGEGQRVTREEAVRMYTVNGAYLALQEKERGSIEPGKLADMIVVDRDVLTCPEESIRDTKVLRTILGGKTVYEA